MKDELQDRRIRFYQPTKNKEIIIVVGKKLRGKRSC